MLSLTKHTLSLHNIHPIYLTVEKTDLYPNSCNISWGKSLNFIYHNLESLTLHLSLPVTDTQLMHLQHFALGHLDRDFRISQLQR